VSPATLARLAVAGSSTDRLRTVLTAVSALLATVAMLGAATVLTITGWARRYTNPLLIEPGLRPGVAATLVLVALPVLALAGQCVRLGAPARDRRLAAIRLAGATPGESSLIAAAETVVASLAGSLLGLVAYEFVREVVARRNSVGGQLRLPTDLLPPLVMIVPIVLLVPLLAGIVGLVLMRRVIVTPLGVVRRIRSGGPRPWPGLLLIGGPVLFGVPFSHPDDLAIFSKNVTYVFLFGGILLTMAGIVLGVGWISHTSGRLLRRFGRGPATLLAGQRLIADPWSGSRTMGAMLAAVIAGSVALGYKAMLTTQFRFDELMNERMGFAAGEGIRKPSGPEFYFGAIRLVMVAVGLVAAVAAAGLLVALAESIVARRRTYAALTATGVPRRTLWVALLVQTVAPLVPAVLLALAAGDAMIRLIATSFTVGGQYERCVATGADGCVAPRVLGPPVVLPVPIPWTDLAMLGGGTLLAALVAVGAGLLVLRSSTDLEELRVG